MPDSIPKSSWTPSVTPCSWENIAPLEKGGGVILPLPEGQSSKFQRRSSHMTHQRTKHGVRRKTYSHLVTILFIWSQGIIYRLRLSGIRFSKFILDGLQKNHASQSLQRLTVIWSQFVHFVLRFDLRIKAPWCLIFKIHKTFNWRTMHGSLHEYWQLFGNKMIYSFTRNYLRITALWWWHLPVTSVSVWNSDNQYWYNRSSQNANGYDQKL